MSEEVFSPLFPDSDDVMVVLYLPWAFDTIDQWNHLGFRRCFILGKIFDKVFNFSKRCRTIEIFCFTLYQFRQIVFFKKFVSFV